MTFIGGRFVVCTHIRKSWRSRLVLRREKERERRGRGTEEEKHIKKRLHLTFIVNFKENTIEIETVFISKFINVLSFPILYIKNIKQESLLYQ